MVVEQINTIEELQTLLKTLNSKRSQEYSMLSLYIASDKVSEMLTTVKKELSRYRTCTDLDIYEGQLMSIMDVCIDYIKHHRQTPKNGLVIFMNLNDLWTVESPCKLSKNVYRCGPCYYTEYLKDLLLKRLEQEKQNRL